MPWFISQYLRSMGDNLHPVTATLWRSAELSASRLAQLHRDRGVDLMLNLRHDLPLEERREIRAAGLDLAWVPMRDDRPPDALDIHKALAVLDDPRIKLVCCKGGRHRTGLVVAVYRVTRQGWTKADAWRECERVGGWYDHGGHKPLRRWFEGAFGPEDYRS